MHLWIINSRLSYTCSSFEHL